MRSPEMRRFDIFYAVNMNKLLNQDAITHIWRYSYAYPSQVEENMTTFAVKWERLFPRKHGKWVSMKFIKVFEEMQSAWPKIKTIIFCWFVSIFHICAT